MPPRCQAQRLIRAVEGKCASGPPVPTRKKIAQPSPVSPSPVPALPARMPRQAPAAALGAFRGPLQTRLARASDKRCDRPHHLIGHRYRTDPRAAARFRPQLDQRCFPPHLLLERGNGPGPPRSIAIRTNSLSALQVSRWASSALISPAAASCNRSPPTASRHSCFQSSLLTRRVHPDFRRGARPLAAARHKLTALA